MKKRKIVFSFILIFTMVLSFTPNVQAERTDVYFSVDFESEDLVEGLFSAAVTAVSFEKTDTPVAVYAVHYDKNNSIVEKSVVNSLVPANAKAEIDIELEITEVSEGDSLKLFAWKDGGSLTPLTEGYEIEKNKTAVYDDFESYSIGMELSDTPLNNESGNWKVTTITEANTKDYSPSLGSKLYASVEEGCTGKCLTLYDDADRTEQITGTGAVMAYRSIPVSDKPYEISFTLNFDLSGGSLTYGGITLSKGLANTTNNKSNPCALQLRFQAKNNSENMQIMTYDSVLFNENSWKSFFDDSLLFDTSLPLDVKIGVDPVKKVNHVTMTDGITTASKTVYFSMMDDQHITNQSWMSAYIDTFAIHTGIGTKGNLSLDDFSVKMNSVVSMADTGYALLWNDFNDEAIEGMKLSEDEAVSDWYIKPIVEKNQTSYISSLGSELYAEINTEYGDADDGAIYVYDHVGRSTDSEKGAGGMLIYRSFEAPKSDYSIKFSLYAPNALGTQQYAGISLGNGVNEGGDDTENYLALQMVFAPKDNNTTMQFDRYDSIYYKDGGTMTFLASDSRLKQNVPWDFDITVMPKVKKIKVNVTDGETDVTAEAAYSTKASDETVEDWSEKVIDTIIFNTSAGNNGIMSIDDFRILDLNTSTAQSDILPPKNVVCRLEPINSGRTNYYLYHCKGDSSNTERVRIASGSNHYYYDDSRFIERPGLADSDGVSFESLTYPGYYLKRGDSDKNIYLVKYKDTDSYRAKTTWYKVPGLADSTRVSYRSYENAAHYLLYDPSVSLSGSPAVFYSTTNTDDGKNHATWKFRSEGTPTMADNFNGTSLSGNWGKNYKWGKHHNHYGLANASMIEVIDGKMKLHAEKIPSDQWPTDTKGRTGIECNIGPDSASKGWKKWVGYMGAVYSYKVYNPPVSMSGRFKTPATRGWWDAFWLNGNNSWPPEIDIFEYRSKRLRYSMYLNVHQSSSKSSATTVSMGDLWNATHTYSLDWTSTYINYYIDGKLKKTVTNTDMLNKQRNMYVIINHGIGGWEYVPDDTTDWSQTFDCEYFKSYQY